LIALLNTLLITTAVARKPAAKTPDPIEITRAYFTAMDAKDIEAADKLFDKTSSLYESGGVQGSWTQYSEHHLGPELEAIKNFQTSLGEPEPMQSKDGTLAVVAWPIEYHIVLEDDREIDSIGTVTFVLNQVDDTYRIRHLHWSSRPKPKHDAGGHGH